MLYVVYIVQTNLPCELFERVDIPEEVATVRENTNNRETNFLKNELISSSRSLKIILINAECKNKLVE